MQVAPPITLAPPARAEHPCAAGDSWPALRARRLLRTARHVPLAQLAARARFMLLRQIYAQAPARPIARARRAAAGTRAARPLAALAPDLLAPEGMAVVAQRAAALARAQFEYLGRTADYSAGIRWHDPDASPLWAFNLHYLGAVLDLALAGDVG